MQKDKFTSMRVCTFLNANIPIELIELLEKIIIEPSSFSNNKSLQNLLLLTAICANKGKVDMYIVCKRILYWQAYLYESLHLLECQYSHSTYRAVGEDYHWTLIFSNNKSLQNLLLLTAICADKGKVDMYIVCKRILYWQAWMPIFPWDTCKETSHILNSNLMAQMDIFTELAVLYLKNVHKVVSFTTI